MEELDILTVTRRSIRGVFALVSRTLVLNIISLGASLFIYSKLSIADVGIYTFVIAVQRIISFFTDFGLGAALVQKKEDLTQADLKTAFTLQFIITLSLFIIIFLLKGFIASYFTLNEEGIYLLLALVFSIFLSSFKTIPAILLERSIRFEKLIVPQLVESLVFNLLLVVLIMQNFGLASYIWAILASSLVGIPAYYVISSWKIQLGINKNALQHLKFGAQFQAKNILAAIKDDLLTVILKLFLNFTEIGYIGFAQRLAFFTFRYVVDSVTKVTFSTYSRMQHSAEHLQKAVEKSLFFVGTFMFPMLLGLIITAPYIIRYFPNWSPKWEPAILSLIFFSLNAMVSSLSNILVNLLDATGRVKTTLKLMVAWTILTWVLTPFFIYFYGYNGVAVASFLVTLTIFFTINLAKQVVHFDFIKSIYKPFLSAIFMGVVVYFLSAPLIHDLFSIGVVALIGAGIYALCMLAIARHELSTDIRKIILKKV